MTYYNVVNKQEVFYIMQHIIHQLQKEKKLNYSEDVITTKGGIKAKVNVTRYYNEKLNSQIK